MLTEKEVKAAQPGEKNRLIADGNGLFLMVSPAGGKSWQYRYRLTGKEKTLSLGRYPLVSLSKAREMHMQGEVVPIVRTGNSVFLACFFPYQAAFKKPSW